MATAPAGGLDRIVEAYRRAVVKLPDNFETVNSQLLRPANEITLVVVVSLWAGLGGRGLGYLEDVIVQSKSSVELGTGVRDLERGVTQAAMAKDERELDAAAVTLRNALVDVGPERVAWMLSNDQFGQLRDVISGMRSQLLDGQLWPGAGQRPSVAAPQGSVSSDKRAIAWWAVGAAAGIGTLLIAVAHAPRRGQRHAGR